MPSYWLLKSEPDVFSIQMLEKSGTTNWNGIRNFQARGFLREMRQGDLAIFYHTGAEKAAVGVCKITREAYPDPSDDGKEWAQVDIRYERRLTSPVPLAKLKGDPALANLLLLRQGRLSVTPLTASEFRRILDLSS